MDSSEDFLSEHCTCPICFDTFQDPVLLECGHTFCRSCIRQVLESTMTVPTCPCCRHYIMRRSLIPNHAVAAILSTVPPTTDEPVAGDILLSYDSRNVDSVTAGLSDCTVELQVDPRHQGPGYYSNVAVGIKVSPRPRYERRAVVAVTLAVVHVDDAHTVQTTVEISLAAPHRRVAVLGPRHRFFMLSSGFMNRNRGIRITYSAEVRLPPTDPLEAALRATRYGHPIESSVLASLLSPMPRLARLADLCETFTSACVAQDGSVLAFRQALLTNDNIVDAAIDALNTDESTAATRILGPEYEAIKRSVQPEGRDTELNKTRVFEVCCSSLGTVDPTPPAPVSVPALRPCVEVVLPPQYFVETQPNTTIHDLEVEREIEEGRIRNILAQIETLSTDIAGLKKIIKAETGAVRELECSLSSEVQAMVN
ncbi:zinc finger protein RFP-like [Carpediemonas membranifera]|uniref:Zinc finger protein RFP-like n=1 Tax=Carpediemonas membranifera TaxID=201153 RepID=A0A8J6E923_9EUKA|nr:zinc finger protein RFP-like [Carpediemonas membranifera]|eukprot:KAG9392710.1 zinc finger protein RFP-like [Carpediemonas membranifera]